MIKMKTSWERDREGEKEREGGGVNKVTDSGLRERQREGGGEREGWRESERERE